MGLLIISVSSIILILIFLYSKCMIIIMTLMFSLSAYIVLSLWLTENLSPILKNYIFEKIY